MQQAHQRKETKFSKTCLYLTFLTQLQTNLLHLILREVRSPEIILYTISSDRNAILFSAENHLERQ